MAKIGENRDPAQDAYRGIAIVAMVIANYLGGVAAVPVWLKHAPDLGLTVIDIVAPMFIFSIGLNFRASWERRRASRGRLNAELDLARRYLAILGLGALFAGGQQLLGQADSVYIWGVLQGIGAAGLIALIFVRFSSVVNIIAAVLIGAGYSLILYLSGPETILASSFGGLIGAINWGLMLILASQFGILVKSRRHWSLEVLAGLVFVACGLALSLFSGISKNRVSTSYVLVSLGICALLWVPISRFYPRLRGFLRVFETWGKNPLFLYCMHLFLLGLLVLPEAAGMSGFWYSGAELPVIAGELVVILTVLHLIGYALERRKISISL